MPHVVAIETSFPQNYYKQEDLINALMDIWKESDADLEKIKSVHSNVQVNGRHLAMPIENYLSIESFDKRNNIFIEKSLELVIDAVTKLLENNNLRPEDISSLWSNTVTGFAIPSLEARLMNKMNFNLDTKRTPLMGLGCMAGVAGINKVSDYLLSYPKEAVIFFSVELCTLTFQMKDFSMENVVSTGLFGDGAAAVLMVGDEHPLAEMAPLKWLSSQSIFFPNTEDTMGWSVGHQGLKIILNKGLPELTLKELPGPLHKFLAENELKLSGISSFFAHPGGPKVLMAIEKVLELPTGGLKHSWASLSEKGNMSSVSVLDILKRNLSDNNENLSGKFALSLAMGPAFSAEFGLLQWN